MRAWFETIYHFSESEIPWNVGGPHRALVRWVKEADPPRGSALVVGSGLGYDALFLTEEGFDVIGIDIAPTAVKRARRKAEERGVVCWFEAADLFDLPPSFQKAFDYVVEIATLQTIPPHLWPRFAPALYGVLKDSGLVVMVCLNDVTQQRTTIPYSISKEVLASCFSPYFALSEIVPVPMYQDQVSDGYFLTMVNPRSLLQPEEVARVIVDLATGRRRGMSGSAVDVG